MTASRVTLLVPGLLAPFPELAENALPVPETPALSRLLGRGRRQRLPQHDYESLLCAAFGLERAGEDLPVAALTHLADTGEAADGYWLRADPVHLKAGIDNALLFGPYAFDLDEEEAAELVAAFNAHFAEDGWQLQAPHPERWYLRLEQPPRLQTHSLAHVVRRNIQAFLPGGEDKSSWHSALNEIQMLFFGLPVNRRRQQRGEMAVNSVWFWGGGQLPPSLTSPWQRVFTDEPLAHGLALHAGSPWAPLPEAWPAEAGEGTQLFVLDELLDPVIYADLSAWVSGVQALEEAWFAPALAALKSGRLASLELLGDGWRCEIRPRDLWRFWKSAQNLPLS